MDTHESIKHKSKVKIMLKEERSGFSLVMDGTIGKDRLEIIIDRHIVGPRSFRLLIDYNPSNPLNKVFHAYNDITLNFLDIASAYFLDFQPLLFLPSPLLTLTLHVSFASSTAIPTN